MIKWFIFTAYLFPSLGLMAFIADAEASPLAFWMPLINVGGIGVVLAFVLWKLEPRMRGAEAAVDRQTRMLAIFLTEMPHIMQAATKQCVSMITELDHAKKLRNDPDEK